MLFMSQPHNRMKGKISNKKGKRESTCCKQKQIKSTNSKQIVLQKYKTLNIKFSSDFPQSHGRIKNLIIIIPLV